MLSIINDEALGLTQEQKNENIKSMNDALKSFNEIKKKLKENLILDLCVDKLKENNDIYYFIKEIYDNKSENYKKEMSYENYLKNVENYIFYNMSKKSNEIINNLINLGFNFYILQSIRLGIQKQFEDIQEKIIIEIYSKLLKID